jgi:hypothetical protein
MTSLYELISYHTRHYKGIEPRDVYKLLFQGTFGPEHLLSNPIAAKEYLTKEWDSVVADENETLLEPISLDGKIIRINLRPAKAKNIALDDLWEAFSNSAKMEKPDLHQFISVWSEFKNMSQQGMVDFEFAEVLEFDKGMKTKSYPAAHHSQAYREKNWPAYRVVLKSDILPYI